MTEQITQYTIRQFAGTVAGQQHAMAGAVIAAGAAQAAALGAACLQITLADRPDDLDSVMVTQQVEQMLTLKNRLLEWCDQDASAIAQFVALRQAGEELKGQQLLCNAPAQMSQLSIEAANLLQNFRPFVIERVRDDLEMSLSLLAGTARAALLLLDSNLRIWPEKPLLEKYEPILAGLENDLNRLAPVARIRVRPKF